MPAKNLTLTPFSYWAWYAVAAATFLPVLGFHYVGEEAIFPISSLEMWHRGDWVRQTIYGAEVHHTPLFNWLIMLVAGVVGWEHMLAVARAITVSATCLTGLLVAGLARVLWGEAVLAAFAGLAYITLADVFFYRGWLAYVDPLFALLVFAAIAAAWTACHRKRPGWLWAAAVALTLAFLGKALTAYVFYGTALAVLFLSDRGYRTVLLSPQSWLAHGAAAALLLGWFYLVPAAGGQDARQLADIVAKLQPTSVPAYLAKLALYPLETLVRLAPLSLVAAYYYFRLRPVLQSTDARAVRIALWIAALGFLPYWLAPHAALRYLMPLYPLVALAAVGMIWRVGDGAVTVTRRWIAVALALKIAVVLVVFPHYQRTYRGENHRLAAVDVLARTAGYPLYTSDDTATGLSVTAYLDVLRLPQAPLTFPPPQWDSGYAIAYAPDPGIGREFHRYRLGGHELFLLCRGAACKKMGSE